jgi:hypothetical protein
MSSKNHQAKGAKSVPQRNNVNGKRNRDEDDHPIEGYRDGSVYEEQADDADIAQPNVPNPPLKPRVNGAKGGDKSAGKH